VTLITDLMIQISDMDAILLATLMSMIMTVVHATQNAGLAMARMSITVCPVMIMTLICIGLDTDALKSAVMANRWATMNVMMEI
jgi:hypothetical protein